MSYSRVKKRCHVSITGKHLTQLCAIMADMKYVSKRCDKMYFFDTESTIVLVHFILFELFKDEDKLQTTPMFEITI